MIASIAGLQWLGARLARLSHFPNGQFNLLRADKPFGGRSSLLPATLRKAMLPESHIACSIVPSEVSE